MLLRISISAMTERPREHCDFKGWVNLRLNFRLNGYISRPPGTIGARKLE